MSWLYAFKPKKDRMLQRISGYLWSLGVTPNMVTTAGLSMAVAAGFIAMTGHLLIGILFFIISACLPLTGLWPGAVDSQPNLAAISIAFPTDPQNWRLWWVL
jgi:hypothetical protein